VTGALFLGGALVTIVESRVYQARQGRAFSERERVATSPPASAPAAAPEADPLVLGRIEIPRVGMSAIVREGDDAATLSIAVGHIPGTARPGERGNVALAGHRDSFFRALRHIRAGDVIRLRVPGRGDEYRVDSTEVVAADETRVLASTRDAVLTLVTCYPFGWIGHAPRRFIVHARLLPAPP
jgi:sortase A